MVNGLQFAAGFLFFLGNLLASEEQATAPSPAALYNKAVAQLERGHLQQAMETLDAIDALHPLASDRAETLNLRGAILIRLSHYEDAEYFLRAALTIEPHLWNAHFNLAEIPFLEKNWPAAHRRFQEMLNCEGGDLDPETRRLIRYKIFLTEVLEGNAAEIERVAREVETMSDDLMACYLRAAIAYQRGESAEAARWMARAQARFPEPLSRLYAESFCEIGWASKPPEVSRERFEIAPANERTERLQAEGKADLARAEAAFFAHDDAMAMRWLDAADLCFPQQAASHNLRAEILMLNNALSEAEAELRQALAADPNLREAAYNLAEIAFRQGRYREARDRFEKLFAATTEAESQPAQLIKFKIFLTFLLDGEDDCARPMMARFQFTDATPALYYAEAAWAFRHDEPERATEWINSALRIYSPALNMLFAGPFYQLGWLEGEMMENAIPIQPPPSNENFARPVSIALANERPFAQSPNGWSKGQSALFGLPLPNDGARTEWSPALNSTSSR